MSTQAMADQAADLTGDELVAFEDDIHEGCPDRLQEYVEAILND